MSAPGHAKSRCCVRAAAGLGVFALLSLPAAAVTDIELVTLIADGQISEARALFARTAPTETDWLFFEGRVAKADAQFAEAIERFQDVLRRDPSYLAARRELAHTLLLAGEYRASERAFRSLLRNDADLEQRQGYQHFLGEIGRLRPFSVSGTFAIVSSSNINRGSSQDTFRPGVPHAPSFEITSDAEPATGVELGLFARHLWRLNDEGEFTLSWGASLREFAGHEHDRVSAFTQLHYGRTTEAVRWSIGPSLRLIWTEPEGERAVIGLNGTFERRLNRHMSLILSGGVDYSDFPCADAQDSTSFWAQGSVAQTSMGGILTLGTRMTAHRSETAHQQYDGLSVFTHFARSWSGGFHGGLGLELGGRHYAADFPLAGVAREDRIYQISVSARHDALQVGRFTPEVACTFGQTTSTVAFFEHDLAECTFGVGTRF